MRQTPSSSLLDLASHHSRGQAPAAMVVGADSALTARFIQEAGFPAVYLTGSGAAATHLAQPDVGLWTLPEMVELTRRVASAVDIPIVVDADTGYGGRLNVRRAVRELENAGASAIQIEDQDFPKRCGHVGGKTLVVVEEMLAKLEAAASARRSSSTAIVARTDARGVTGLEDAIERSRAYQEVADITFIEALLSADEFRQAAKELGSRSPLIASMSEGGVSPLLSAAELGAMGFSLALFPGTAQRAAQAAIRRILNALQAAGTQRDLLSALLPRSELDGLLGLEPALSDM